MKRMEFYVYVIKSDLDGRLYKGMTSDLKKRLRSHNGGKVKSTKGFRPWKIVRTEVFATEQEARQRELYLKSGAGRAYLQSLGL
jgi:putative endonuclease